MHPSVYSLKNRVQNTGEKNPFVLTNCTGVGTL